MAIDLWGFKNVKDLRRNYICLFDYLFISS